MNIIIPPYIVAWMRNITAAVISLALIWIYTPMIVNALSAVFFFFGMSFVCFLITMIATKREIFVGLFYVLVYMVVDAIKMYLDPNYMAQNEFLALQYGLLDFLSMGLFYSLASLMGTTPVYLWRRWQRKM